MLPGSIFSMDGKMMPFEIEMAHRSGRVVATDLQTNEAFAGTYVATIGRNPAIATTMVGDTPRIATVVSGSNIAYRLQFRRLD